MFEAEAEAFLSFWEHFEALRRTLLKTLITVLIGLILSFCFYEQIMNIFLSPLASNQSLHIVQTRIENFRISNPSNQHITIRLDPNKYSKILASSENIDVLDSYTVGIHPQGYLDYQEMVPMNQTSLLILSPFDGLRSILSICTWTALIATAPIWGIFWLQFFAPGLREEEKRIVSPLIKGLFATFSIGVFLAFYCLIPVSNRFFEELNTSIGVNQWALSGYINYTWSLLAASCLTIQVVLIILCCIYQGWVSFETLRSKRNVFILFAFVFGALITPPDVPSQLFVAITLILFYELAIWCAKIRTRLT